MFFFKQHICLFLILESFADSHYKISLHSLTAWGTQRVYPLIMSTFCLVVPTQSLFRRQSDFFQEALFENQMNQVHPFSILQRSSLSYKYVVICFLISLSHCMVSSLRAEIMHVLFMTESSLTGMVITYNRCS